MKDKRTGIKLMGLDYLMRVKGVNPRQMAKEMNRAEGYNVNILHWRRLERGARLTTIKELATYFNCTTAQVVAPPNIAESIQDLTVTIAEYSRLLQASLDSE
jgi:hypothetical protein